MNARFAIAVGMASLLSSGALAAQQPAPARPAPTAQQSRHATPAPRATAATTHRWSAAQIKEAQEGLKRAKVYTGPVNGVLGRATRRAIRAFQLEHKLPVTGALSDSLLDMLKGMQ